MKTKRSAISDQQKRPLTRNRLKSNFLSELSRNLFACLSFFSVLPFSLSAEKPNILLILVDDLKPSYGAYGDDWVHSPNLDRLAQESVTFDLAYANQAVCMASRVNLMLGSRSTSTGVYDFGREFREIVPEAMTLPELFKRNGWHTEAIGKVFHIGHGNRDDVQSWSVPSYYDKVIDYVLPQSTHGGQLTREEALFSNQSWDEARSLPRGWAWERADVLDEAYSDGRIAAQAIRRLRVLSQREEPFFLAVGFVNPHLPFSAPEKYWQIYDGMEMPIPERQTPPEGAPPYASKPLLGELNQYFPIPEKAPMEEDLIRILIQGYYACVSFVDAQVGRVMEEFESLGLGENTVVVFWGDHGFSFGHLGNWTKHTNYEEATRIPLKIRAPGLSKDGGLHRGVVETVDIFPTLLELAGIQAPSDIQKVDGRSLVPALENPNAHLKDYIYHCYPRFGYLGRAIRTDRYRMVEWVSVRRPDADPVYELYDYIEDRDESRNLAEDKPEVLAKLREILARHPAAVPVF